MRICYLAPGNSIHSYRWVNYFKKKHEVFWISLHDLNINFNLDAISFYNLSSKIPINLIILSSTIKIKTILMDIKPDIIHIHSAGIYGFIGYLLNFTPCVLTAWGSDVLVNKNKFFKRFILKKILLKASLITTDAEHMKKEIVNFGVDEKKVKKIMFGIDINFFKPLSNKKIIRKKLGLNSDEVVITSFRNFYKVYDIITFIRAAHQLSKQNNKLRFLLIGSGPEESSLKKLVKALNLDKQTYFTGSLPQEKVLEYLRASDIYVSTSLSDAGISSSTAEAMACGLVPIITEIGENNLWVRNSFNGFLFPPGSIKELTEHITKLIYNKDDRIKFSKNTRDIIEKKNNYYVEMSLMEKIYIDLVKTKE